MIDYFKKRGISQMTLKKAKIGYQQLGGGQKGAMMFPRYKNGEVVAIKYRTYSKRYELHIHVASRHKPLAVHPVEPGECHETLADVVGLEQREKP